MRIFISITGLFIFVFLLYSLFSESEQSGTAIMIASLSAFILYFLSLTYDKRKRREKA